MDDQHQNYADNKTAFTVTDNITSLTTTNVITDDVVMFHANRIKASWQKAVSSIVETGLFLLEAKKAMSGTGKWSKLFDKKLGNLPFSIDTAQLLMKVARHPVLSNTEHARSLPPSWYTLAVLSDATEKQVKQWIAAGDITPDTQRSAVEKLVNPKKAKAKAAKAKAKKNSDDDAASNVVKLNVAPSNEVQQSIQHTYTLATDAKADWTNVDWEMVDDLIEELQSRKRADADKRRQDKEWQAAEAAKLITPPPIEN